VLGSLDIKLSEYIYVNKCFNLRIRKCDTEGSREDSKIYRPYNRNIVHVECKKKKLIPVMIGATGTISKSFRKYLSNITGKHIKAQQQTATLGTAHVLREVLM
jgi:hypothetical protein